MSPHESKLRRRPKVLFFAEDVTLAHVGRMLALAGALDSARFEVVLACGPRYRHFADQSGLRVVHLETMGPEFFADALAKGAPIYTQERLQQYLATDLALMAREAPDLVVGDFRCSLGTSAELAGVPYYALSNGAWSPNSTLPFPVPELPVVRVLGVGLASALSNVLRPRIFRQHLAAFNALRRAVGLSPHASLSEAYTHATRTFYADIPSLAPTSSLPAGHEFLGPVLWEPQVPLPRWWRQVPDDRPVVYVNLGSSGDERVHGAVVQGLADQPVTVLLATAGRNLGELPKNFLAAHYLPGMACANRAQLVICNGGSGTIYQALAAGVPVLGIPSNADQYLCTEALIAQGAGQLIRAGMVTPESVRDETKLLLAQPSFSKRAQALAAEVVASDALGRFARLVAEAFQVPNAVERAA